MHPIVATDQLSPNVTRLVLEAPRIAEIRRPGQFVIVRLDEGAERIPLTIADADAGAGTISLIIQSVGASTMDLVALQPGDAIRDVAGPLGRPTDLLDHGHAVCVGGGVGTAVVYPIAQELHRRGVSVTSVIGGRSREWVIMEEELRTAGDVVVCTDDGSYGRHGFVTEALKDLCEAGGIDEVFAVGPVPMMRAVAELTRPYGIRTTVSLNAIMVDGTGMCGGCRVAVDGETKYACVDGPEFDGHTVDFKVLADRLTTYRAFEQESLARHEACLIPGLANQRPRPPRVPSDDRPASPAQREGADGHRAGGHARTGPRRASGQLPRGQPRADPPDRDARSRALPAVPQAVLHRRLPGQRQYPALPEAAARGRPARRGGLAARRQRAAVRDRPGLPAGEPVRGRLPARRRRATRSRSAISSGSSRTGRRRTRTSSST